MGNILYRYSLMSSLINDLSPLIFSKLKYYDQDSLARISKMYYGYYCAFKKQLCIIERDCFFKQNQQQKYSPRHILFDETTLNITIRDFSNLFCGCDNNLGSITINLNTMKFKSHIVFPSHLHMDLTDEFDDAIKTGRSIIQIDKYNKLKSSGYPTIDKFYGRTFYCEYEGVDTICGMYYNADVVNYKSLAQHINELLLLHKLFFETSSSIHDFFEPWMTNMYDKFVFDYSPKPKKSECDKCKDYWAVSIEYDVSDNKNQ